MNTMKRKFSLNLPPVKVPMKHADPPASSHTSSSHHRHHSKDSFTAPTSPFICRRPLDPQTERELRAACKLILQNFKPSDADFADVDPKLDFSGPHKHRDHRNDSHCPPQPARPVRVHRPTGAPSDVKTAHHAQKTPAQKYAVKAYPSLPMLVNTSRPREESEKNRSMSITSPSHDTSRAAIARTDVDSDDAKSLATPLTASTDPHHNSGSTAPTSVGSHRGSRQYESAAAAADAQATEWMRQELEKRRQKDKDSDQTQAANRPPSRANSIRAGIKDYIFPGSKNLSRSQSKESMRTDGGLRSAGLKRSGSITGWRSWGTRISSSRSSSRPGSSMGRTDRPEHDKQSEVDLNRKLPPLPSLDTWKDPETETKDRRNSQQMQSPHIANVMRTQNQQQEEYAAAVRRHHRRSGSDTLALRHNHSQPSIGRVKSPDHTSKSHKKAAAGLSDIFKDFDQIMSSVSSRNLDDNLEHKKHAAHGSISSISGSTNTNPTADNRLHAPNFSRKISGDMPRSAAQPHIVTQDAAYLRAVQISGPQKAKGEQKSSLKKVLSGWMGKKEKKEDWMERVEKSGTKGGFMTQEEAAAPPVVRY